MAVSGEVFREVDLAEVGECVDVNGRGMGELS